jgi:hypothetical protein
LYITYFDTDVGLTKHGETISDSVPRTDLHIVMILHGVKGSIGHLSTVYIVAMISVCAIIQLTHCFRLKAGICVERFEQLQIFSVLIYYNKPQQIHIELCTHF